MVVKTVTVEWLLHWAFGRQQVHRANAPGLGSLARFAPRGWPGVSSSERIGAAVGSSMNLGFEAPPDAHAVMQAVDALGAMARVVRAFALANGRPDWTPSPVLWVERGDVVRSAVYGEDGKTVKNRRGKTYISEFTQVYFRGDLPEIVEERRRAYTRWADAVAKVRDMLRAERALVSFVVSEDVPPRAPWAA